MASSARGVSKVRPSGPRGPSAVRSAAQDSKHESGSVPIKPNSKAIIAIVQRNSSQEHVFQRSNVFMHTEVFHGPGIIPSNITAIY